MSNTQKLLIAGGILAIVLIFIYARNKERVCYALPLNKDPKIFGPHYWSALHSIVERIPCGECRGFAEKFMVFFHDVINDKLSKPLYNSANYQEMITYLNTPKQTT